MYCSITLCNVTFQLLAGVKSQLHTGSGGASECSLKKKKKKSEEEMKQPFILKMDFIILISWENEFCFWNWNRRQWGKERQGWNKDKLSNACSNKQALEANLHPVTDCFQKRPPPLRGDVPPHQTRITKIFFFFTQFRCQISDILTAITFSLNGQI